MNQIVQHREHSSNPSKKNKIKYSIIHFSINFDYMTLQQSKTLT